MSDPDRLEPLVVVSVVMPALNAASTIEEQLDALSNQDFDEPWELVVVDNGSSDDTPSVVEAWRPKFHRLRVVNETVRGVNRARNTGVRSAEADRILMCDADDVAGPGWIKGMFSTLNEFDLVAGRLDYDLLNTDDVLARSPARPLSNGLAASWRRAWGMTSNLGFRRPVFDAIEGFDPRFQWGGSDDVDFCLRAGAEQFTLGFAERCGHALSVASGSAPAERQLYRYAAATNSSIGSCVKSENSTYFHPGPGGI